MYLISFPSSLSIKIIWCSLTGHSALVGLPHPNGQQASKPALSSDLKAEEKINIGARDAERMEAD